MPFRRGALATFALAAALSCAACAEPPDKEIQQAQTAIDAARAGGAGEYARDDLTGAEDALKKANDAVAQRDYRLALNHALDARERAQTATKDAATRKAAARIDAERALGRANVAVATAHAKLKAAETAHVSARAVASARRAIAQAEQTVQKARAAMEQGDYLAVIAGGNAATPVLQGVAHDLDAAMPGAARRKR